SLSLNLDDVPMTLNSFAGGAAELVQSSLWLPLAPRDTELPSGHVVFYAQVAGAFNDLAQDAGWMLVLDRQAVLDGHLSPVTAGQDGIRGFREFSDINQAAGVLIAMGETPESARTELHRRALLTNQTVLDAARDLLSSIALIAGGGQVEL
ncbi:MAG: hypothetical protein ABJD68_01440, partial [Nakamurella sp.]